MAPKRVIRKTHQPQEPSYPSLRSHLSNRRRFLGVAGASLATVAIHAGCNRSLGAPGDADASVPPDSQTPLPDTGPVPGGEQQPQYYTIRIPVTDELSGYLLDEGYAQFHVEAVTYVLDTENALIENMSSAEDTCRQCVSEYTYDSLNTAAGVAACEDDLLTALDDLVMDLESHSNTTVEYVTLTITYLEPYAELGGIAGEPSYP